MACLECIEQTLSAQESAGIVELQAILDTVVQVAEPLLNVLEPYRQVGLKGYPLVALLRAYIASLVWQMKSTNALWRRLDTEPHFNLRPHCRGAHLRVSGQSPLGTERYLHILSLLIPSRSALTDPDLGHPPRTDRPPASLPQQVLAAWEPHSMTHSKSSSSQPVPQAGPRTRTTSEWPGEVEHFLDVLSSVLVRVVRSKS